MSNQDIHSILNMAAGAYGSDPGVLDNIARLESGYNPGAVNDWDSNARRGTPSEGLMQFIEPTFNSYAAQARKANPSAWRGVPMNWRDPKAQALAASWAIANGKGKAWATYGRALNASHSGTGKDARVGLVGNVPLPAGTGVSAVAGLFNKPGQQWFASFLQAAAARRGGSSSAPPGAVTTQPYVGHGKMPAGRNYQWIQQMGEKLFGLHNDPGDSQTIGGHHTKGSEHYKGRAVDFGGARNSPQQLKQWEAWARAQGLDVLNEGDHIHVSLPGGGV